MTTTSTAAPTTLTARTSTSKWSGTTTYGEPALFAEATHGTHAIAVYKQPVSQELLGNVHTREESEVLVDGKRIGRAPAGTAKQVLRKIAAQLDEADSDRELLPRVTALMSREIANTRLVDALTDDLQVGDVAMVYGTGSWRRGVVVKVTAQKATVAYTTPSSNGRIFRKAADLDAIRIDVRRAPVAPAAEVIEEAPAAEVVTEATPEVAEVAEATERAALDTLLGRPTAHRTAEELSAPAAEDTVPVRVGQRVAEAVALADGLLLGASLRTKLADRKPTKDGTRLVHLDRTERAALDQVARNLEVTARQWVAEGDRRGVSVVWSAQRLQATLAAL